MLWYKKLNNLKTKKKNFNFELNNFEIRTRPLYKNVRAEHGLCNARERYGERNGPTGAGTFAQGREIMLYPLGDWGARNYWEKKRISNISSYIQCLLDVKIQYLLKISLSWELNFFSVLVASKIFLKIKLGTTEFTSDR